MATVKNSVSASVFEDLYPIYVGYSAFDREVDVGMILHKFTRRSNVNSNFVGLIESRCGYLDSLKNLTPDWISGGPSQAPSEEVLEEAKTILVDFGTWVEARKEHPVPRLVMGPIPTGGIGLEFIVDGRVKISLNLHNGGSSEMEVEDTPSHEYMEINTTDNSIPYLLKQAYKYFTS